jgi:hypothetical protein
MRVVSPKAHSFTTYLAMFNVSVSSYDLSTTLTSACVFMALRLENTAISESASHDKWSRLCVSTDPEAMVFEMALKQPCSTFRLRQSEIDAASSAIPDNQVVACASVGLTSKA